MTLNQYQGQAAGQAQVSRFHLIALFALALFAGTNAWAQLETGEIRLSVTDPSNLPLASSSGVLISDASHTQRTFNTDDQGRFTFAHLPFGFYRLAVEHPGFQRFTTLVEVRSAVPRKVA